MSQTATETALIEQAQTGCMESFRSLFQRYRNPVFNFVLRMLGQRQDAEDVVQEVFVKVYRNLAGLRESKGFSSWLFGIARNETINHMRRFGKAKTRTADEPIDDPLIDGKIAEEHGFQQDPETQSVHRDFQRQFMQALEKIPEINRSAFLLGVVQGFSYKEVADMLDCSITNVKSRVFRARAVLCEELAAYMTPEKVPMP